MLHLLRRSTPFIIVTRAGDCMDWAHENPVSCETGQHTGPPTSALSIERALDKPTGATITNVDMAILARLYGDRANIRDLTGLEFATNLISLHLRSNQLSNLSPPCKTNKSETSKTLARVV